MKYYFRFWVVFYYPIYPTWYEEEEPEAEESDEEEVQETEEPEQEADAEESEEEEPQQEFTVEEKEAAIMYAKSGVNVRKGPSQDYEKIGSLSAGQEITVTGVADTGWYQITYQDQTGYCSIFIFRREIKSFFLFVSDIQTHHLFFEIRKIFLNDV